MFVLQYSVYIFIIKASTLYSKILDNRPNLKKVWLQVFQQLYVYRLQGKFTISVDF